MIVRCVQAGTTDDDRRTAAAPAARSAKIKDFEFEEALGAWRRSLTSPGSQCDASRSLSLPH
jgi:hypothetical protein